MTSASKTPSAAALPPFNESPPACVGPFARSCGQDSSYSQSERRRSKSSEAGNFCPPSARCGRRGRRGSLRHSIQRGQNAGVSLRERARARRRGRPGGGGLARGPTPRRTRRRRPGHPHRPSGFLTGLVGGTHARRAALARSTPRAPGPPVRLASARPMRLAARQPRDQERPSQPRRSLRSRA